MRICLHTVREVSRHMIGGTERFLVELAKELRAIGHDAFILCSGMRKPFNLEGVRIHSTIPSEYREQYTQHKFANSAYIVNAVLNNLISEHSFRILSTYTDKQLSTVSYDVAHLNSFASSLFVNQINRHIVMNHENDMEYDSTFGEGFTRRMIEWVKERRTKLHNAGRLITPSQYYADYFAKHFNIPVTNVGGGISLTTFDRTPIRNRKKDRTNQTIKVLLPSRFAPNQKGHDLALQACRILTDSGFATHFQFSGIRDDYRHRLEHFYRQAQELLIADRISLTRFEQIQSAYENCDVVISPERYCSYGLAISESLSLGIPTALTDIPTYREIANGFRHAYFFEPDNPRLLASEILRANETPEAICEEEAVRFRMQHDFRDRAKAFNDIYLDINRSSISV